MSAINFNRLTNQTMSFFNDRLIPTLSPLQKKVALIALAAITLIAAWLVFAQCWKKDVKATIALDLTDPETNQKAWMQKLDASMKEHIKYHSDDMLSSSPKSGVCFVNIQLNDAYVKRQFIFKNQDGSSLTQKDCLTNIEKLMKSVQGVLYKGLGLVERFDWFIVFKGDGYLQLGYNEDSFGHRGHNSSSGTDDDNLQEILSLCAEAHHMGIPQGTVFFENREFVQGPYYKNLQLV